MAKYNKENINEQYKKVSEEIKKNPNFGTVGHPELNNLDMYNLGKKYWNGLKDIPEKYKTVPFVLPANLPTPPNLKSQFEKELHGVLLSIRNHSMSVTLFNNEESLPEETTDPKGIKVWGKHYAIASKIDNKEVDNLDEDSDRILMEFEINKTNASMLLSNSKEQYISGLGMTDYTVHKDCIMLSKYYREYYIKKLNALYLHNYHVTVNLINHIALTATFKSFIKYKENEYELIHGYIGISDCICVRNNAPKKYSDETMYIGKQLSVVDKRIMFVVTLKLKNRIKDNFETINK